MNVLIADDDSGVLDFLSDGFESFGFEVTTAANRKEALERFAERAGEWSLVVTDVDMGTGPSGLALLREVRSIYPDLPVLVISGEIGNAKPAVKLGAWFLQKPFSLGDLKGLVGELVG